MYNVLKDGNDSGIHAPLGSEDLTEYGLKAQPPRALDGLQVPSSFTSTDSVLAWPIFNDYFGQNFLLDELLIAEHMPSSLPESPLKIPGDYVSLKCGGICDDDIPNIITRFLRLVHIKNPILDSKSIKQFASRVAEHGLGWDPPSCLVVSFTGDRQ